MSLGNTSCEACLLCEVLSSDGLEQSHLFIWERGKKHEIGRLFDYCCLLVANSSCLSQVPTCFKTITACGFQPRRRGCRGKALHLFTIQQCNVIFSRCMGTWQRPVGTWGWAGNNLTASLPPSLQPLQSHAQPHATCLQWPAAAGLSPHTCLVGTGRAVLGSRGREGSRAGGSIFAQLHLRCPAGIAAVWRDGSRGSTQHPCVLIALPIQSFTGRESDFSSCGFWSEMHPDSPSTAIRHKPETGDPYFF